QVKCLEGQVKYADRVHNLKRIPQQVNFAFQTALLGKPGPVYLDFPGDVLYSKVEEDQVDWSYMGRPILRPRPYAEPKAINALVEIDAEELGRSARNVDIPVMGDCKSVLQQLIDALDDKTAERFQVWRQKLADGEAAKRTRAGGNYPTDGDIHPLRLCEEIKN